MDKFIYLKKRIKKRWKGLLNIMGLPIFIILSLEVLAIIFLIDNVLFNVLTQFTWPIWLRIICIILMPLTFIIKWFYDIFIKED